MAFVFAPFIGERDRGLREHGMHDRMMNLHQPAFGSLPCNLFKA